jgi:beta-glucanase (GH16 family)
MKPCRPALFCILPLALGILLAPGASRAGEKWQLIWHDEFNQNGAPNPTNWTYETGFVRNQELQWYQPENAWCTNGHLIIEGRPADRPNPRHQPGSRHWQESRERITYTSASLITRGLHEFTYGKFEMRARIDVRSGSWPAFWTLGTNLGTLGWPACGEIDIMEFYNRTVLANFGWQENGQTHWLAKRKPLEELPQNWHWARQFHVWTMEWTPEKIDLLLDGRLMNHLNLAQADTADQGNPFHQPQYIILNQAIGANGGPTTNHPAAYRFEVDWVRVYQHPAP